MYQYSFDEKTTDKITDSTKKAKDIFDEFAKIDDKYIFGDKYNYDLDLKKIDYVAPTQEEVEEKAKNTLQSYKNQEIKAINDNYDKKNEQINQSVEQTKENSQLAKNEIKDTYSKVKQDASNDAIKRGLARSSIIVSQLSNYDNKMLNELSVLASETNDKLESLSTQKNSLELEKNNALNDFDIEYAVKLQNEIDTINSDIAKAEQTALKYNNEIAEIEAKWAKEQNQTNYDRQADLLQIINKYGSYAIDYAKQNEKYALAKQYFSQMDKDVALEELQNNPAYKRNIGSVNYNKLIQQLTGE